MWLNQLMRLDYSIGEGEFLLPSDYFEVLCTFAASYAVPFDHLLAGSGVVFEDLFRKPEYIGNASYNRVIQNLIAAADDPLMPWKYGLALSHHSHGVSGFALRSSKTLWDAYELLPMTFSLRTGRVQSVEIGQSGRHCIICLRSSGSGSSEAVVRFNAISSVMLIAWWGRSLIGAERQAQNERIEFAFHEPTVSVPGYLLPPGASVAYECQENSLLVPIEMLRSPVLSSNPQLQAAAVRECEMQLSSLPFEAGIEEQVRRVFRILRPELPTIDIMAGHLKMSVASLKRRLKERKKTFQEMKNDERFSRVVRLLRFTELPLSEIAHEVGFSDPSSLSKAFKTRYQKTPGQFRRSHSVADQHS